MMNKSNSKWQNANSLKSLFQIPPVFFAINIKISKNAINDVNTNAVTTNGV